MQYSILNMDVTESVFTDAFNSVILLASEKVKHLRRFKQCPIQSFSTLVLHA